MLYLICAVLWPLAFVALYFLYPMAFPNEPPLNESYIFLAALLGMAAFTFAGALRVLGFLRNDQRRRERPREDLTDINPK